MENNNKKNNNNSSNSLVFGRWPQTKILQKNNFFAEFCSIFLSKIFNEAISARHSLRVSRSGADADRISVSKNYGIGLIRDERRWRLVLGKKILG